MLEQVETFGKYILLERLAVGGMAEIFKAKTRGLSGFERVVAIKRLHRHLGQDEELVQMLIDEARLAVQLTHANIGQVFDLGVIDEQYFIVMEYIPGIDVHRVMRALQEQNQLAPIPIVLYIISEMLAGLDFAHNFIAQDGHPLDIVHRDVSPQNIMFSTTGDIKLVDFGIAKARMQVMQTQAGIIKGKFYYMSPEQAHGQKIDRRTDVYATGMVLYELLTGRPAYEDGADLVLLKRVRACDFAPPSHWRRDLDPELEAIVMRALHKDLRQRYQTARDLQVALVQYAQRKFERVTKPSAGEFLRHLLEPGAMANAHFMAPNAGRDAMVRDEFSFGEDSVIFDASHLAIPEESGFSPFAEASFAGQRDEENPFADANEPTFVYTKEEDNPFAIPDDFAAPDEKTSARAWGFFQGGGEPAEDDPTIARDRGGRKKAGLVIGGAPSPGAPSTVPTPAVTGPPPDAGFGAPVGFSTGEYQPPGANGFAHAPPEPLGPREVTVRTRPAQKALGFGAAPRSQGATTSRGTSSAGAAAFEQLFEPENRTKLLAFVAVLLVLLVGGVYALLQRAQQPVPTDEPIVVVDTDDVPDVNEPIEKVEPEPPAAAIVAIQSSPSNAKVYANGALIGNTPTSLKTMRVGDRAELKIEKDGHVAWEQVYLIQDTDPSLNITLDEIQHDGKITVLTKPEGLHVSINGQHIGKSPCEHSGIDTSTVQVVQVKRSDDEIKQQRVTWIAGDKPDKEVVFDFTGGAAAAVVEATPEVTKGTSKRLSAAERRRRLRVRRQNQKKQANTSNSGSKSSSEDLDIWGAKPKTKTGAKSGGSEGLDVWGGSKKDAAGKGYVVVKVTDQSGQRYTQAHVYIDGVKVSSGSVGKKHSLDAGRHKVKVYFPTYKRFSNPRTVTIEGGKTKRISFRP